MKLKLTLVLGLFLIVFSAFSQKVEVTFTVTYLEPYCGGARPSAEMEEKANTPQAYSQKTIILVNEKGRCLKVKTNAEGLVISKLKVGNYQVFEVWRHLKKTPDATSIKRFDKDCLEIEWKKEIGTLTVDTKGGVYTLTNGIVKVCDWNVPCMLDTLRPQPAE